MYFNLRTVHCTVKFVLQIGTYYSSYRYYSFGMKKYIIFRKVIRKLYNLINLFCFRHMFPFSIPKLQMSNLKTLKTSCKLPKKDWSRPNFTVSRSIQLNVHYKFYEINREFFFVLIRKTAKQCRRCAGIEFY